MISGRFARFVLVGAAAAAVNIAARILLSNVLPFQYAVIVAFPIALTFAFLMSRIFVFEAAGSAATQYFKFFLVNLVALVQVWLVSVGLALWLFPLIGFQFHAELVAHAIGVCSPIVTSYYAHKLFTFR